MALQDVLRGAAVDGDRDYATAVAAVLNADQIFRRATRGASHYGPDDVIRLGLILAAYNPTPLEIASARGAAAARQEAARQQQAPAPPLQPQPQPAAEFDPAERREDQA